MNRVAHLHLALLTSAVMVLPGVPILQAQRVEISVAGIATQPRSTLVTRGIREAMAGVWAGGALALTFGPVTVTGVGLRGNLTSIENTGALKRGGGEVGGWVTVTPVRWVGLEAGYTVRAFSSAAGYQRWNVSSAGIVLSSQLGDPSVRAYMRGVYLSSIKVIGQPSPDLGIGGEVGVTLAPGRAPFLLRLSYRLERYDFPGATRVEQFDAVSAHVGIRWGRQ